MNKLVLLFAMLLLVALPFAAATSISNCSTTISSGGYYILTQDLGPPTGTNCIAYTVGNFVLDCNGNTITLNGTGKSAIFTSSSGFGNITVKNCIIEGATNSIGFIGPATANSKPINLIGNTFNRAAVLAGASINNADISNNVFENSPSTALGFSGLDRYGLIRYNQFINNTIDIDFTGAFNANNTFRNNLFNGTNTVSSTGNFWTDNTWTTPTNSGFSDICLDVNVDGFCDAPYQVDGTDYDTRPIKLHAVNVVVNNPPIPSLEFLGLDTLGQNFVFSARLFSDTAQNGYYALLTGLRGTLSSLTAYAEVFPFSSVADLPFVSNTYCNNSVSLVASAPIFSLYLTGALRLNQSTCLYPTTLTVNPVGPVSKNNLVVGTSLTYTGSGPLRGSVSLYDATGRSIGVFILDTVDTNVTAYWFGTNLSVVSANASHANELYTMTFALDFSAHTVAIKVYDHFGTAFITATMPFENDAADGVGSIVFNENSNSDTVTWIGSVSVTGENIVALPSYLPFATLEANAPVYKAVYDPIAGRSFAAYEANLWGTTDYFGLSFYGDPFVTFFNYTNSTPLLTPTQIAAYIDGKNAAVQEVVNPTGPGSGDIATDVLKTFWEDLGFKSVGSKILLGLIFLVILTFCMSGFGSEVIIIIDIVGMIAFAYLGLFPIWFVAVIIILAATFAAFAIRKATTGQG